MSLDVDAPVRLPVARGPMSAAVLDRFAAAAPGAPACRHHHAGGDSDAIVDEDLQLALYLCYELHYGGLPGVDDRLEWDPALLTTRAQLERRFEASLRALVPPTPDVPVDALVEAMVEAVPSRSVAGRIEIGADVDQVREYVLHRSAYQRKEGDPHTWAIPRLDGAAKQHLVRIQAGEYGVEEADRHVHAELFAATMRELELDDRPNAHVDRLPAVSLALSNLISMFGLHRRLRAAAIGHLALSEITSVEAMRRYVAGLRRLGVSDATRRFFEVHVLADAEHEVIAVELLRAVVDDDPALHADIAFGIGASLAVEQRFAEHLLGRWDRHESSLRWAT